MYTPTLTMEINMTKEKLLFDRAINTLEVYTDIKNLNEILESDKLWFRDQALGETLDVVVPGVGKIQVKKPSPGGISTSTVLNLKKFEECDQAFKHACIKAGIVEIKTTSRAPSLAAVVVTLNV